MSELSNIEKYYTESVKIDEETLFKILEKRKQKDAKRAQALPSQQQTKNKKIGTNINSKDGKDKLTNLHHDYSKDEVNFKAKQTYVITEADILDKTKRAMALLPKVKEYFINLNRIRNLYLKTTVKELSDLKILDLAAFFSNNVNVVDAYVHAVSFSGPTAVDTRLIRSIFLNVLNPPQFNPDLYGYDVKTQKVLKPTYRYLGNHDLESIRKVARVSLENETYGPAVIANAVLKMFEELSDQNRFGTIIIYIKMLMEMKQVHSEGMYHCLFSKIVKSEYGNLITAEDTVSFQALIFLLKKFKTFPFRVKDGVLKMRVDGAGFSTSIPGILYTLINNTTNEMCGNLSRMGALTALEYLGTCASTSLMTSYLNHKSDSRSWFKYFLNELPRAAFIHYAGSGEPIDVAVENLYGEHFRNSKDREMVIPKTIPICMIGYINTRMNEARKISKTEQLEYYYGVTEFARFVFMEMNVITNPSLFFKTSLVLEYEKSIEPRIKHPVDVIGMKEFAYIDDRALPFSMIYKDDLMTKLERKFDNCYGDIIKNKFSDGVNWEAEFVIALTNKSGGIKNSDQTMLPLLRSISNTRLLNFVTGIHEFTNIREFNASLTLESRCAIRYQNDRRSRLIVIVPNTIQSSEIFLLYVFNKIKMAPVSDMFVGKTVGDIRDVFLQLVYSSKQNALKNNSDISGMDAHTLPSLSNFIRQLILKYLLKYDTNKTEYFASGRKILDMYNNSGSITAKGVEVPAAAMHAATVMRDMRTLKLHIPDKFFGISMNSTDETFMSGLYGTSAQHTILLDVLMKVVLDDFLEYNPKTFIPINRIMGDDRFEVIPDARSHEKEVEKYLKMTDDYLYKLNYTQDADTSYYHAKFLQQNAIFGVFTPLVSRTSIWTAERADTVYRQPLEIINIMASVVNTYAQRSYSIENAQQFLVALWNNIRCHSIYQNATNKSTIANLKSMSPDITGVTEFIVDDGFGKVKICYPFVTIFVAPIGWPMTAFHDSKHGKTLACTASTTMAGDYSKLILGPFFATNTPFVTGKMNFDEMFDWAERAKYGFTFGEYLMKFTRARILSSTREEALKANITESAAVLEKYLDPLKKAKSIAGISFLRGKKIRVTEGISYVGQPKAKIKQALASRLESLPEASLLDNKFLQYISKFTIKPDADEILKHSICTVTFSYVRDESKMLPDQGVTIDGYINSRVPFLPGYHKYSSYGKILTIGETPLRAGKTVGGSIAAISAELGATYDVENAVRFGASVMYQRGNMTNDEILNVVCDVMGLSPKARPHYKKLVLDFDKLGAYTEYQTIFDNVKFFCISGSKELFSKYFTIKHTPFTYVNLAKYERYLGVMVRDAYFAGIDFRKYEEIIQVHIPQQALMAMLPERIRHKFRQ